MFIVTYLLTEYVNEIQRTSSAVWTTEISSFDNTTTRPPRQTLSYTVDIIGDSSKSNLLSIFTQHIHND